MNVAKSNIKKSIKRIVWIVNINSKNSKDKI